MKLLKQFTAVIIIYLLIWILVGVLVVYPTVEDIRRINQTIAAQKTYLESRYAKRRSVGRALVDFRKTIQESEDLFDSILVDEKEKIEFITHLERTALFNQVKQKIEFDMEQGEELNSFLAKIPLRLTLAGDFIQILKYLADLEKMRYYIFIDSISITSPKLGAVKIISSGEVKIAVSAHFYLSKEKE